MYDADDIRRWLEGLPTPGQEEDMFGRQQGLSTRGSTTNGETRMGGSNDRLRRGYEERIADVRKNGVQSRSANSPRSNRRSR